MITKQITNENGTFTIIIHSASSVAIRIENENPITINKIPYTANAHYAVADMIFTETYRFVSRSDAFSKEATYEQKARVCQVLKSEAFNYIFAYPELLVEAQKIWVNDKMNSLKRERDTFTIKATEKQTEIDEFWEANRAVFTA